MAYYANIWENNFCRRYRSCMDWWNVVEKIKEIIPSVVCRVYEPLYDKERGKLQRRIVEVSVIYTLLHNKFVKTILAASWVSLYPRSVRRSHPYWWAPEYRAGLYTPVTSQRNGIFHSYYSLLTLSFLQSLYDFRHYRQVVLDLNNIFPNNLW